MRWTSEFRTWRGCRSGTRSGCLSAAVLNVAAVAVAGGVARLRGIPACRPRTSAFAGISDVWGAEAGAHAALDETAFLSAVSARPSRVANWASAALRSSRLKTCPSGYQAVQESLDVEIDSIVRPPDGLTASVSDEPSAYWASIPTPVIRKTPMTFATLRASATVPSFSLMNSNMVFCTAPFEPTISRARPPSAGISAIVDPSIAMSFLPTIPSSDGDDALAVSFGGGAAPSDVAAKPFVVIPAKTTVSNTA